MAKYARYDKARQRSWVLACLVAGFFLSLLMVVQETRATTLVRDTTWSGEVTVAEDLFIPKGVTLTIAAGTRITVVPAESTKIDPEFLSHQTEIVVRGRLVATGTEKDPVSFTGSGAGDKDIWAGIIVDGGDVVLRHGRIERADTAVLVMAGTASLDSLQIRDNHYGVVAEGEAARLTLRQTTLTENDYGLIAIRGAKVERQETEIKRNKKKDSQELTARNKSVEPLVFTYDSLPVARTYGEEAIVGDAIWNGHVLITGVVRISPEARLIVMPGTVVTFSKRDTNGDGIGENGLMVQGQLIAKGTAKAPIVFRSAEKIPFMGDWDSVNILGSDQGQNLLEYVQIEDAYRGVHFHFSNVGVNHAVFRNNYRGAQFQESLVAIRDTHFWGNKSAIQARDSQILFKGNHLYWNMNGANFFRVHLDAADNRITDNRMDGLRIREGEAQVENNRIAGNRMGLLVADATFGRFEGNLLIGNAEVGLALRDSDHLVVAGNVIEANGVNGISLRDTRADITGNLIAGNGERGVGVLSFAGSLRGNSIIHNGLYGIGVEGAMDVDAVDNWWGQSDLEKEIYDRHDEEGLGEVRFAPARQQAPAFSWPSPEIAEDIFWGGEIRVDGTVTVARGATLAIYPGSRVAFGRDSGLEILGGRILAEGTAAAPILFTAAAPTGASDWNEVKLEYAEGSRITYCDFSHATWGLHVHFSPITISFNRFIGCDGGIRFRGGPVTIENNLFSRNNIGIRDNMGVATIRHNRIEDNEMGIFVSNKGAGVTLRGNHFVDNRRYALRLGDFNQEDVDARENWWNGKDPRELIFDAVNEPGVGLVQFEPALVAPPPLPEWLEKQERLQ